MKTKLLFVIAATMSAHVLADIKVIDEKHDFITKLNVSGNDAKTLNSVFKNNVYESTNLGISNVNCIDDTACELIVGASSLTPEARSSDNRPAYNFNSIEFFKQFSPQENDNFLTVPTASFYYHNRDEILEGDKKLFKLLDKNKSSSIKRSEDSIGEKLTLTGENFEMTCQKYNDPESYKVTGGHPHIFTYTKKIIRLKYECRTFIKATK